MADREKLIELLGNIYLPMTCGPDVIGEYHIPHKFKKEIADYLIANGVTIQRWIPVTERLPKPFTPVLVYRKSFGTLPPYIKVDKMVLWNDDTQVWTDEMETWKSVTTHWMPLPEAPKGE